MLKDQQQRMIIISAPSGTGKSTIIRNLLANNPCFKFSVSSTTRKPRAFEKNGVEYHFLTKDDFEAKIKKGDFLEYEYVHNNYYGTSIHAVEDILNQNCYCILDIDVKGAKNLISQFPYSKSIFISPPNMDTLKNRLVNRGDTSSLDIDIRIQNAYEEMQAIPHFKYHVINDHLETTIEQIKNLIYDPS